MKKILILLLFMAPVIGSAQSSIYPPLGGGGNNFDGNRTVTRSGIAQVNAGGTTIVEFLNNYFFPSTYPGASISVSGGISREFMSTGANLTTNITWTASRPSGCLAISSIVVNSISQTLDNPFAEGHTQSGALNSQSLPRNTNTSYNITVSSSDKATSTVATITWYWGRYWGAFSSGVPPTDGSFTISNAQILALTGAGVGTGYELSTTMAKTYNGINGGGNYLVFAFPTSWGTPTFVVNGLTSSAFTLVRNNTFTNVSGGSTTYSVWVSNTTQSSAISQFQIQ
jgi:hypothetical protein